MLLASVAAAGFQLPSMRGNQKLPSIFEDVDTWVEANLGPVTARSRLRGRSVFSVCARYAVGGGKQLFVKASTSRRHEEMYLGEALGLEALTHAESGLAVPAVLHSADGSESGMTPGPQSALRSAHVRGG